MKSVFSKASVAAVLAIAMATVAGTAQAQSITQQAGASRADQMAALPAVPGSGRDPVMAVRTAPAPAPHYVWTEGYERGRWRGGWELAK